MQIDSPLWNQTMKAACYYVDNPSPENKEKLHILVALEANRTKEFITTTTMPKTKEIILDEIKAAFAIYRDSELSIFANSIKTFAATDEMYRYEPRIAVLFPEGCRRVEDKILTTHGMMVFDHAKLVWTTLCEIHGAENIPSEKEWYKLCNLGDK